MNKLEMYHKQIRTIDQLSNQQTFIHSLSATTKLITTIIFLITVIAQPKEQVAPLLALFIYPIFIISAGNIQAKFLAIRLLIASPFIIFFVISGLLFSNSNTIELFGIKTNQALVVAINISLKFILSILASTLLLATSGYYQLAQAIYKLPLPKIFLQQIIFSYRYIHVLLVEIEHTLKAYLLKAGTFNLQKQVWGSLVGQLLLKTINRCEKIHQAMILRGFNGQILMLYKQPMRLADLAYIIFFTSIFGLITIYIY